MSPIRRQHYLEWAQRFYRVVPGNVGVIPGDIYPLWHGGLEDRHYGDRQSILARFDFDPYQDIALDANGCWR